MKINVTRSSMPTLEEFTEEIRDLWDSRWLTNMGAKHHALEEGLCSYLGVQYLTLFTNGHLGLEELIRSYNFPQGSEIITTPFTFASTTHAIVRSGLKPVFCDIDPVDFTMDEKRLAGLITGRTVGILPVHVYGHVCHVDAISALQREVSADAAESSRGGLKVFYDAAHTFGAWYRGRAIADYGDAAILSFHATKVFHTVEGGAVVSHSEAHRELLEDLRNYGIRDAETVAFVGGNAKMSELQAAMGLCNLRHIGEELQKRKAIYELYLEAFSDIPGLAISPAQPEVTPNYAYFPVVFEDTACSRDEVFQALAEEEIGARKYFYPLTSAFSCYAGVLDPGETPVAARIADQVLTLPLYADLTKEDAERIIGIVLKCLRRGCTHIFKEEQ